VGRSHPIYAESRTAAITRHHADSFFGSQKERGNSAPIRGCAGPSLPLGDLFVVYNHNLRTRDPLTLRRELAFASNQLLVKMEYAFRY